MAKNSTVKGWSLHRGSIIGFAPIPALVVLITVIHLTVPPSVHYDPAWLILTGNTLFVGAVSSVVCLSALRNYRLTGRLQVLLLGCGVLSFGIAGVAAALVRRLPDGANLNVTIYNTGALAGAAFHFFAAFIMLAGISPEVGSRQRKLWLGIGYVASALLVALPAAAALAHRMPVFFVQGVGPTLVRQQILGTADILFVFSFLVFMATYLRNRERFLYWYACALALTAISLTAFFIESSVGSPVGWAGRFSQYVGGIYFLIALATAVRSAQRRGTSLDNVLTTSLSGVEEKFRALAENTPDAIRRFDREFRHTYVNAAGLRQSGRPGATIIGKTLEEAGVPAAQCELWKHRILNVFQTGRRMEVEDYVQTESGVAFFQSHCVPEYGPDGSVTNVLVVSRDLTGHKRTDEALRESEQRLRRAQEIAHLGSWERDVVRNRIVWSDEAYRIFGLEPQESGPTYQAFLEAVHPEDRAAVDAAFSGSEREHRDSYEIEHRVIRKATGEVRFVHQRFQHVRDDAGRIIRSGGMIHDITERRRAEERLRHAQRLESVGLLAGGIAHDFNNLLVGVIGSASLAIEMLPADSPVKDLLHTIVRSGEQAAHLTSQMLAFSGKGQFVVGSVDLSEVIGEVTDLVRSTAPKKAVIQLDLEPGLPPVEADRSQIHQVLMNLVINATEAIGDQAGLVVVRTGNQLVDERFLREIENAEISPGRYVFLEVRDTGCGMDEATKAKIFDPFFTTKFQGRGLGLAAVAGIVRGHKGAVRVRTAPGRGTTFTLLFPALDAATVPPAAPHRREREQDLRAKGMVLVVDDEETIRNTARLALERRGCSVMLAGSGVEAIAMLEQNADNVSLAILDLSMPEMSGWEVLPKLLAIHPGLAVVVSSGYAEDEAMRLFAGMPVAGFLQKPYTARRLVERVQTILDRQ